MSLGTFAEAIQGSLGLRFRLVGILPTALLVAFIVLLMWAGVPAHPPAVSAALNRIGHLDAVRSVSVALVVLVLAIILQPFQLLLIRVLEGYWGSSGLARMLARKFADGHRLRRDHLKAALDAKLVAAASGIGGVRQIQFEEIARRSERLYQSYPRERFLPTTLGNVLRAIEENAGAPYGLDIVTVWPRLFLVLPERTASLVDEQRTQLDLAARLCVTFLVGSVVSAALLYRFPRWLMVPLSTVALAWLCYRGAIASALAYGAGIRAAIDLHRFDLLVALRLPLPEDRDKEKVANERLCDFLRQGIPVNLRYVHPSRAESPPSAGPTGAADGLPGERTAEEPRGS